jgi:hypothetical protein
VGRRRRVPTRFTRRRAATRSRAPSRASPVAPGSAASGARRGVVPKVVVSGGHSAGTTPRGANDAGAGVSERAGNTNAVPKVPNGVTLPAFRATQPGWSCRAFWGNSAACVAEQIWSPPMAVSNIEVAISARARWCRWTAPSAGPCSMSTGCRSVRLAGTLVPCEVAAGPAAPAV